MADTHISQAIHFAEDYLDHYQPYKGHWCYEDGCALTAAADMYRATNNNRYGDFVLQYLSARIEKDGTVDGYENELFSTDTINSGKSLFFAYEMTGENRYRSAIEYHMNRLRRHPRTNCGSFWHKDTYPNQVWLDGLYMVQPFYMEYEMRFNGMLNIPDIVQQFQNVRRNMWNPEKELNYHAWDESKTQPWCNSETGLSPNFWLRSTGWYLMALIDCIDLCDEQLYEHRRALTDIFRECIRGIMKWQDPQSGLFYQVIDRADVPGNYIETSGSSMIAYAVLKGARLQILSPEKYLPIGLKMFDRICETKLVRHEDTTLHLKDICKVAGLGPGNKRDGSVEYYLSEPVVEDDIKGAGPFIMALSERIQAEI